MKKTTDAALLAWTLDQWAMAGAWLEQSGWIPLPTVEGAKRAQVIWHMAYSAPPQAFGARNTDWAERVMLALRA